jgi:hypothetical protein
MPYVAVKDFVNLDLDGNEWNFAVKCLLAVIPINISCLASFMHIIAISVERCFSLAFPIKHKVNLTIR